MIQGLVFQISSEALAAHLKDRAMRHHQLAEEKRAKIPELKDAIAKIRQSAALDLPAISGSNASHYYAQAMKISADPVGDLEKEIKQHEDKERHFKVLAAFVVPNDLYHLHHHDLGTVELIR